MPIYTEDPGQGINQPIGNAPAGLGESALASFSQGFMDGPLMSGIRFAKADSYANDETSPVVTKQDADAKLKELGIKSINIPDSGVTQSFLDHLSSARKEALAKQQIAASAPSGLISTPINVLSGLAGAMADPANLALGLIPFAGEARAASFLGRFGERFVQGAAMGAAQTAVALPFTAQASAAEGEDFTMANAFENIVYGTVGGGLIHAGGGVIADAVRGRRASVADSPEVSTSQADTGAQTVESSPIDVPNQPVRGARIDDDSATPFLDDAIAREADSYAYSRAYDDVTPDYMSQLEAAQSGKIDNVADVRARIADNNHQSSRLDATLSDRISTYQQQRIKYKAARQRALDDIAAEKARYQEENSQLNSQLEGNAAAERATGEQASISRGELPEGLKSSIEARANQIKQSLQKTPISQGVKTASQRINEAHWTQRQNAYRAGMSHMLQGKAPDIEPFFSLENPDLRQSSFEQIQRGPRSDDDVSTARASEDAESQYQRATRENDELVNAQEDFDSEIQMARTMVDEIDSPELKEALDNLQKEAGDESIFKGLQAYATCMLRRI